jgi:hypothetical protein
VEERKEMKTNFVVAFLNSKATGPRLMLTKRMDRVEITYYALDDLLFYTVFLDTENREKKVLIVC